MSTSRLPPLQPTRQIFDPYNSSSTGHQTAKSLLSGSTRWRDSRTHKLQHQLRGNTSRGATQHLSDLVGSGSENFRRRGNEDWEKGAPGLREDGWRDIREMIQGTKMRSSARDIPTESVTKQAVGLKDGSYQVTGEGLQGKLSTNKASISTGTYNPKLKKTKDLPSSTTATTPEEPDYLAPSTSCSPHESRPLIFHGLNIYINGSTLPHISDHKLKHLLVQHGANVSIALGRRTVTHVILGDKGLLAAGKIQKEVAKTRGKSVKFVGVQWVLDSMERGKRQPERRYEVVRLAMKGQRSVVEMGSGMADITRHDHT